jgi:hypothetical protein
MEIAFMSVIILHVALILLDMFVYLNSNML